MLLKKDLKNSKIKKPSIFVAIIVGIVIGGLSGLIGIGGGIILTPVILLLHWGEHKRGCSCICTVYLGKFLFWSNGTINKS